MIFWASPSDHSPFSGRADARRITAIRSELSVSIQAGMQDAA